MEKRKNFKKAVLSQVDNDVDDLIFEANRKLSKDETESGFVTTIDTAALVALATTVYAVVAIVVSTLWKNSLIAMWVCLGAYCIGAVIEFMFVAATLRKNYEARRTRVYVLKEVIRILKDNKDS